MGPITSIRERVLECNLALPKTGLVAWTGGNASGRDVAAGVVWIKPSGVPYDRMRVEDIVGVDLTGRVVYGTLRPSVDTPMHLAVYRQRRDINGIIHTHSPYATSYALRATSPPVGLLQIAYEFGGEVPLTEGISLASEEIGNDVVAHIGDAPAILLRRHGVLTVGGDVVEALKAAIMLEEACFITHLAELHGKVHPLPTDTIRSLYEFYHTAYGQKGR